MPGGVEARTQYFGSTSQTTWPKVIEYEESKSEIDLYYLMINYLLINNIFQKSWLKVIEGGRSESVVDFHCLFNNLFSLSWQSTSVRKNWAGRWTSVTCLITKYKWQRLSDRSKQLGLKHVFRMDTVKNRNSFKYTVRNLSICSLT
jgi:hypothetical protein